MRKTREELLKIHPSWNEEKHDIVKVFYGDIPLYAYTAEDYMKYIGLEDGTYKNLCTKDAYIWSQMGDFSLYRTLMGEIYLFHNNGSISGDFRVKNGNYDYPCTINLNQMYGLKSLDLIQICTRKVIGFSNIDGIGSPCIKQKTEEMKDETIIKLLNSDISDYGEVVKDFFKQCLLVYNDNNKNHIMNKCFSI